MEARDAAEHPTTAPLCRLPSTDLQDTPTVQWQKSIIGSSPASQTPRCGQSPLPCWPWAVAYDCRTSPSGGLRQAPTWAVWQPGAGVGEGSSKHSSETMSFPWQQLRAGRADPTHPILLRTGHVQSSVSHPESKLAKRVHFQSFGGKSMKTLSNSPPLLKRTKSLGLQKYQCLLLSPVPSVLPPPLLLSLY